MRRALSLKLRATLIFFAVFGTIFLAGFILLSWQSLSAAGERHHAGPAIALALSGGELHLDHGKLSVKADGDLADLAARNPHLWLLVDNGQSVGSWGPVPGGALRQFERYRGEMENGRFQVRGVPRPLADATLERRGALLIAAGGVDPATISLADAFRYILAEGFIIILGALGAVGLVAMLVALPLLTRALRSVTADAAGISPDRPDRRIDEAGVPGELLPLVRGFNSALDRLSTELDRRKRFIADVAHELRTPLSILSLQIESLSPHPRRADLERVLSRVSHLVGQMLDVERLSLGGRHQGTVDLVELAADVLADITPIAVASGYEVTLEAPPGPIQVHGDVHALSRALANLIGNAVAHACGQGEIRVRVTRDFMIDVLDEGPGISEALRPHLFEAFSRERWDRDGCGMGLHLTREIMRAHGGDAMLLETRTGSGFRLVFS